MSSRAPVREAYIEDMVKAKRVKKVAKKKSFGKTIPPLRPIENQWSIKIAAVRHCNAVSCSSITRGVAIGLWVMGGR